MCKEGNADRLRKKTRESNRLVDFRRVPTTSPDTKTDPVKTHTHIHTHTHTHTHMILKS